jgi:hypothetical protein
MNTTTHLFRRYEIYILIYLERIIEKWNSSILTTLADSQQNLHDNYLLLVHSVEIPLMINSGPVRKM